MNKQMDFTAFEALARLNAVLDVEGDAARVFVVQRLLEGIRDPNVAADVKDFAQWVLRLHAGLVAQKQILPREQRQAPLECEAW